MIIANTYVTVLGSIWKGIATISILSLQSQHYSFQSQVMPNIWIRSKQILLLDQNRVDL